MQVSQELLDSLSKAKTRLMLAPGQQFSATYMLNLEITFDDKVPTACTNGLCIKLGTAFWQTLTPKQQVFLLAHETWHGCFDHMGTRGNRDPQLYNMACDYVINHMLVNENGMEFIEGGLLDSKYAGMSSHEVYALLEQDPEAQEQAQNFETDLEPADSGDGEGGMTQEQISQKIQDLIMQAAVAAEMSNQQGSIPDELQRRIHEIRNPQLPWNTILINYFTERTNEDYSWAKRNRRYRDVYLPSLCSFGMGAIRAYFDASGSITEEELNLQCAELQFVQELMNPSEMTLRAFSHYMGREQHFDRGEAISLDCDAGGGTELQQVIDDIVEASDTEVAIIFTDGHFNYPNTSMLDCDVIWVITNNPDWKCPRGYLTIHMKID